MPNKKNKSTVKKVLIIVSALILVPILAIGGYFAYQVSRIDQKGISLEDIGINFSSEDNVVNKYKEYGSEITNIALFGIDSRKEKVGDVSHSDSMMILSIDKKHDKIKLSSLLRDSLVNVDGYGETKLTHAYAYGGPELALKTINQNFNLNIEDYVTVDFSGLTEIIDSLGGIEIDVNEKEIEQINKYGKEIAQIMKEEYTPIEEEGIQILNGHQATAYARIRKIGNGDFDRVERQKDVLVKIAEKIQDKGITSYPSLISSLIPYVQTSASTSKILGIATDCLTRGITTIDWYRFPLDGYCDVSKKHKDWALWIDNPKTTEHIHEFIYEDIKADPKEPKF